MGAGRRRVARELSPVVAAAGAAAELGAVAGGGIGLAAGDGPAIAWTAVFLAWQWVGLWLLVRPATGRRRTPGILAAIVLSVAALLVVLGWVSRLHTGRFLEPEGLRLAAANPDMIAAYLAQAEPGILLFVAAAGVATLVGGPLWLRRRDAAGRRGRRAPGRRRFGWVAAWLGGGVALLGPVALALGDPATAPARWKTTPVATLAVGGIDLALAGGPDPDCLDRGDLVPLRPVEPVPVDGPSVLLVAVESLRHDVLFTAVDGRAVTPNLDRLAREGAFFTRAFTTSTHSDYADPSALSSLYPLRSPRHHYYSVDDPWPKTLAWDLVPPGWATALFSAQNEGWGRMDAFLASPALDLLFDARTGRRLGLPTRAPAADEGLARKVAEGELRAGKLDDAAVADAAVAWLGDRVRAGERFLLALNLQSPHFPYELADDAPQPFQPGPLDLSVSFSGYAPAYLETVRRAYLDSVRYADAQLGRVLDALAAAGRLDDTIVAAYGENGELFGEHGLVTHAKAPWDPALRVAFVLRAPGGPTGAIGYPASLVDLLPTVKGLLGAGAPHPGLQGVDLFSADRPPAAERRIFFHNETVWSRADGVVLAGRWKYWRDRETGSEHLFDLVTDPGETSNLVRRRDDLASGLSELTAEWRCRQLAYYGNPLLFEAFFPPPVPGSPSAPAE